MSLSDSKYIQLISYKLRNFRQIKDSVYQFSCPICGDSKTNSKKARGYIFKSKENDYMFKCHNGCQSSSFSYFLKQVDDALYREYLFEQLREGKSKRNIAFKGLHVKKEIKYDENITYLQRKCNHHLHKLEKIISLDKEHVFVKYLNSRHIPKKELYDIWYCKDFNNWVNLISPNKLNGDIIEERIVFPMRTVTGNCFGFIGRSLAATNNQFKYISIVIDEMVEPRVYGLHKHDNTKPTFITEGIIDSLFLPNSLAICGSDIKKLFDYDHNFKAGATYIMDNEPRNFQICKKYATAIQANKNIVILQNQQFEGMDANDIIMAGYTQEDLIDLYNKNTFNGIKAKLVFANWKK